MRLSTASWNLLVLFAGPIVWAVHFVAIYGFTGVACARPATAATAATAGPGWQAGVLLACGLAAAAVLAGAMRARPRSESPHNLAFLRATALALDALALLAIAWETLAVFLVPGCWQAMP